MESIQVKARTRKSSVLGKAVETMNRPWKTFLFFSHRQNLLVLMKYFKVSEIPIVDMKIGFGLKTSAGMLIF